MEVVGPVVDRQGVCLALKGETPVGYTVGVAARGFAGARPVGDVVGCLGVSDDHICHIPFTVGNAYGDYPRSEG